MNSDEKNEDNIKVSGRLKSGDYSVRGDISSQFITGLLLALPLLDESSNLEITGKIESRPYIDMTLSALSEFGMNTQIGENSTIEIHSLGRFTAPEKVNAEGDWSNAAFWCVLGALSENGITISDLNRHSVQGDKAITDVISQAGADVLWHNNSLNVRRNKLRSFEFNCSDTPDLVPAISILASACDGETKLYGVERLRLKESDRIETTMAMVRALGGEIRYENDTIFITGKPHLAGGTVDSFNDHRIAMSAAVASVICENNVTILGANAVNKSYRSFWNDFESVGGNVKKWEE